MAENDIFLKKVVKKFGIPEKTPYLCTRKQETTESFSSFTFFGTHPARVVKLVDTYVSGAYG